MDQDSLEIASTMLRALIAGASCEDIACRHGVTKSAVSQRIRVLAGELQQIVGVVGVEEEESPTAGLIRENGDAYLEALEHFVPEAAPALNERNLRLAAEHLDKYVAKITRHSRCARRDTALLLTLFSTGAKPLEIAQFEVRDYLDPAGYVRTHSTVRAQIAMNRNPRDLYFRNLKTNSAIDAYLSERQSSGMGTHAEATYRGLQPQSRLFLSRSGTPMQIRKAGAACQHLVCKEIHEIYRRIFAYSGRPGINTASARRLAAQRLREDGADPEEIGRALGIRKLAVYKLLQSRGAPSDCSPAYASMDGG
jgi:integrase